MLHVCLLHRGSYLAIGVKSENNNNNNRMLKHVQTLVQSLIRECGSMLISS